MKKFIFMKEDEEEEIQSGWFVQSMPVDCPWPLHWFKIKPGLQSRFSGWAVHVFGWCISFKKVLWVDDSHVV